MRIFIYLFIKVFIIIFVIEWIVVVIPLHRLRLLPFLRLPHHLHLQLAHLHHPQPLISSSASVYSRSSSDSVSGSFHHKQPGFLFPQSIGFRSFPSNSACFRMSSRRPASFASDWVLPYVLQWIVGGASILAAAGTVDKYPAWQSSKFFNQGIKCMALRGFIVNLLVMASRREEPWQAGRRIKETCKTLACWAEDTQRAASSICLSPFWRDCANICDNEKPLWVLFMVAEVLEDDFLPASVSWNSLIMVMNLELEFFAGSGTHKSIKILDGFEDREGGCGAFDTYGTGGCSCGHFMKKFYCAGWGVLSAGFFTLYPPFTNVRQQQYKFYYTKYLLIFD